MYDNPMSEDDDFDLDPWLGPCDREKDLKEVKDLAKAILADPKAIIIDTETTGIRGRDRIVEFAAITTSGEVLADFRVDPQIPIGVKAQRIHGISNEDVDDEPAWEDVFPPLWADWKKRGIERVVIYNSPFDIRIMRQSSKSDAACYEAFGEFEDLDVQCAMMMYSAWVGDWEVELGEYRWQKLPGGDHSALGDCRATLNVLRKIAGSDD